MYSTGRILKCRGAEGSRTLDLYNANVALSQLSYCPNGINKCTSIRLYFQMIRRCSRLNGLC